MSTNLAKQQLGPLLKAAKLPDLEVPTCMQACTYQQQVYALALCLVQLQCLLQCQVLTTALKHIVSSAMLIPVLAMGVENASPGNSAMTCSVLHIRYMANPLADMQCHLSHHLHGQLTRGET